MTILEIDSSTYHADQVADQPSLSCSIVKVLVTQSPAHARAAHPRLNPNYQAITDEKYDVGTIAHSLLLEGEAAVHLCYFDDWRTAAAREERDEARSYGRIPLLAKNFPEVEAMVAATRTQLEAFDVQPALFTNGLPERTLVWEEQGVTFRARLDWLHNDYSAVDDFKSTTRSAAPEAFSKTLYSMLYHVQARMYQRAVMAVTGREPAFRFCVAETSAPHALSVFSLTPAGEALADQQIDWAIATWKRCLKTDQWPAYVTRVCYAEPPGWVESQWLEREVMEAAA